MATYKCGCGAKCVCTDTPLTNENGIQINNKWYHTDCWNLRDGINKARDYFLEHVNKLSPVGTLVSVLNNLVYSKSVNPEVIIYGMYSWKQRGKKLNYPQGLYYVVQDSEVHAGYERYKMRKIHQQKVEVKEDNSTEFTYIPTKEKSIEDLFT